jgi:hypothetical protein
MPIRFRLPWGLLASVLGFAAAWLLLDDAHGHLLARCVVHALGAGLLGAAGWRISERLTDYVNLHTSPLLRLALPGAGAIWLATEAIGVFSELSVGSGAWWPEALVPLLLLLVGLLPMAAGITLLAGLETMFAARRGGGGMFEALRPIALYIALAVAALAGIGYLVASFPDSAMRASIALAPDRARVSGWAQREQRLFAAVHEGWSCDILVVPLSGGTPSLDRAARSLITRHVAAQLALRSGLCVADPTLVARALGARERAASTRAVNRLADAIGARYVVRGEVRMDPARPAFDVVLGVRSRGDTRSPWSEADAAVWGPLAFSDELPPEVAFAHVAREAAEALGIALDAQQAPAPAAGEAFRLPGSLAQLGAVDGGALGQARMLQLLAAAHHASELDGEHLWERSLIALSAQPASDEQARVLRARAALHLGRRPYALQLLESATLPEAAALRALAHGNLTDAERAGAALGDAASLTLELELAALRARYGKPATAEGHSQALLDSWPGYAALLYVPLSASPAPGDDAQALIVQQLAALGAQVRPGRFEALAAAAGLRSRADAAADIERSRAQLWRAQAGAWRAERAFDRVAAWDAADALYAANRAAVTLRVRALAAAPGRETDVLAQVRSLGQPFSGHLGVQSAHAVALQRLGADAGTDPGAFLAAERARRLQREVVVWEGGEGDSERELRARFDTVPPAPADEPPRAWRPPPRDEGDPGAVPAAALHFGRMQAFAQDEFGALQGAIDAHERADDRSRAAQLLAQARARFVGDPARERYLLRRAESTRDLASAVGLLRERIREQPSQWATYVQLARAYLRAQEPALAQRALLDYPGFHAMQAAAAQPGGAASPAIAAAGHGAGAALQTAALQSAAAPAPAGVATPAAEGGMLLLWAGEAERARPFLELAARPGASIGGPGANGPGANDPGANDPGANDPVARVTARMALAQLDGNWPEARRLALELHEGHGADGALTRAATLAFLLGEPEAGWRGFYEASKRVETIAPWASALDGHRLEGTKADEVVAFAKRWKSLSGERAREIQLRQQFLFGMFLVDRAAADWVVETLTGLDKAPQDAGFASLVRAYAAFKNGDFPRVVGTLEPLQQQHTLAPIALPWLALALRQSGRAPDAQALLQAADGFDALLAAAYVAGTSGAQERALNALWDAFLAAPAELDAAVPARYRVLEACERLHALTGEDRYRQLAVDLARRQQRAWPVSWAYAFEARYATHPDDVERALGAALFLDAQSEHLQAVPQAARQRAAERFARHNAFRRP